MKARKAFEAYGRSYDDDFTHSKIGKAQRKQVWRKLQPLLKPGMDVLEINCGTGEDAIALAKKGINVVATDIADNMIGRAREKRDLCNQDLNLQFHRMGFEDIDRQNIDRQFDLVFSNFGGLNCLSPEATRRLSCRLAQLVRPSGRLFLVYMSQYCIWESAYHFFKGETEKEQRRRQPMPIKVRLGEDEIDVWYAKFRETAAFFYPEFSLLSAFPIGLFVPPSYLEHFFRRNKTLLRLSEGMDRVFALPLFSDYADHQALIFEKVK